MTHLLSCTYLVIKGLSIYRHVAKCRCLIQGILVLVLLKAGVIYRICHELTVEIKFYYPSLKNMLLSEPLASSITCIRTSIIKFYQNSQRMSDSFYHITESSELNGKVCLQNILIWPCRSAMFWKFCVGIHMYRPMTS